MLSDSDSGSESRPYSDIDQVSINKLLGCAIRKAFNNSKVCDECIHRFRAPSSSGRVEETLIDMSNMGRLIYPGTTVFNTFKLAEKVTQEHLKSCKGHKNLQKHLVLRIKRIVVLGNLDECHRGCISNVVERYVKYRMHIHGSKMKQHIKDKRSFLSEKCI
jgi:hypothetical protein